MDERASSTSKQTQLAALTRQLLAIEEQIQALSGGEIDAVISARGQSFLLSDAQARLRASEAEQRQLVLQVDTQRTLLLQIQAMVRLGSWTLDAEASTVTPSDGLCRILALEPGARTLSQWLELMEPADRSTFAAALALTQEDGQQRTVETRQMAQGGSRLIMEHHWRRDGDGPASRLIGTSQDITERRAMEEQLRRHEAQWDLASRIGKIGTWRFDIGGNQVLWSDQVCLIHEMPIGTNPTPEQAGTFYPPDSIARINSASQQCIAQGTPYDIELELTTARGNHRWVRAMGEALRNESQGTVALHGAFQDISDRKYAEQAHARLAAQLASTFENLDSAFFALDPRWHITYVNTQMERRSGVERSELIGKVLWDVLPELCGTALESVVRNAANDRATRSAESYLATFSTWCLVRAHGAGEVISVYVRDISAERSARMQLELLQKCVTQLSDLVMITDAGSIDEPEPRILYANEALYRLTGYTPAEVLGRAPRMFQGAGTDTSELTRIALAMSRGEAVVAELLNYSKDGRSYWIEMKVVPVRDEGGGQTHFIAVQRDISESKQNHERLMELAATLESRVQARTLELEAARREAVDASRAKSTFLATMSHEIRTPMNGVIGLIDVLRATPLQTDQIEIVDLLIESATSLLAIIEDILDFSKIEAGRLQLESLPLRLGEEVEKVCAMLLPSAAGKDVEIYCFIDPQLPLVMMGDQPRLRQVLVNLIGNAIKFSSRSERAGQVWVRATCVTATAYDATFSICISDNGIGMDAAMLERLFTAFDQADVSTTRRYGGTGLGLAITRSLVELMKGNICVRSTPDIGSEFTVHLCLQRGDAGTSQNAPTEMLQGIACRIVGTRGTLAPDIARYLTHAGATVESFDEPAQWHVEGPPDSPVVWVLLPSPSVTALRRRLPTRARCVVLGIGKPQFQDFEAATQVMLDARALTRESLYRAVAKVCGREPTRSTRDDQRANAAGEAPAIAHARATRLPVLVAEDNEMNREVIKRQLRLLGYPAQFAPDGRRALQMWREGSYSMLITDLRMPGMDGFGLATTIRSEQIAGQRMPIIALTANALPEEAAHCRAAGMDDYLTKPLQLDALRRALEQWSPSAPEVTARLHTPADLAVLGALVGTDPLAIASMLKTYRTSARLLGAQLVQAALEKDHAAAAAAAHRLKSNARAIGAMRLGELCASIESAPPAQDPAAWQQLARQAEVEAADVDAYLQSVQQLG